MNGVHDMGGMQGFGPVCPEPNEPVFHAAWEGRVRAMFVVMRALKLWNIDASRFALERLPPADYLSFSYFEKWLAALIDLTIAAKLVTAEEVAAGRAVAESPVTVQPPDAAGALQLATHGRSFQRESATKPRFAAGQTVRARNINTPGHTRLPRYVRGRAGTIHSHHGAHVFPDSNAHFAGEAPQHLYTVRFTSPELWGEQGRAGDEICLDLWESYLDPV